MVEAFGKEIGRHLLSWSGWLFTVGGTSLALWWAREHWGISLLIVLTFAGAALTFSYQTYRKRAEAETRHESEMSAGRAREQAMADRVQEVERKLLEVPSGILLQLQRVIQTHSFAEMARRLVADAEFVERMRDFANASSKPIAPKVFTSVAGELYVLAKAEAVALTQLRVGDPFLLMRRAANGLETLSARLVVHQPSDPKKETVCFRIADFLGDEMNHIDSLARSGDVEGIKGYRVQAACDIADYENLNMSNLSVILERLIRGIDSYRGGAS